MRDPLGTTEGRVGRSHRMLSVQTAAAMLGTAPETLTLWEERFGYPVPEGSVAGRPVYRLDVVIALRDALDNELSVASAIDEVRRRR